MKTLFKYHVPIVTSKTPLNEINDNHLKLCKICLDTDINIEHDNTNSLIQQQERERKTLGEMVLINESQIDTVRNPSNNINGFINSIKTRVENLNEFCETSYLSPINNQDLKSFSNLTEQEVKNFVCNQTDNITDNKLQLNSNSITSNQNIEKINNESCKNYLETSNEIVTSNQNGKSKSWDILCKLINCKVAFKKQYNGKKYNWIQLAGHAGRFKPGDREGFILKIMEDLERKSLELLQTDKLSPFVPKVDKIIFDDEDKKYYSEMQDLLYSFNNPSIMDIKIGVRTFLEDDENEKESKPRSDLYLKLIEMAPDEPTPEENQLKKITKRRYMSWRESSTCSATLGFRIEAIKKDQVSEKEFFSVREKEDVKAHFENFTNKKKNILKSYLDRLIDLQDALKKSDFFYDHEMIGSSLLFVHDNSNASAWMIDFGKTRRLPFGLKITHDKKWHEGNHEDGYLIGIENLIKIFQELILESN